jgi:hypothetical protein
VVWFLAFPASAQGDRVLEHLRWLALYLPGPDFALIVVGIALLAVFASLRRPGAEVIAVLLVFLVVPLCSFLINPMVTPAQPWGIRRFVPMAFPLLVACAMLGFKEGASSLASRIGEPFRYGYLAMAVVVIVFLVPQAALLWRQPLYRDIAVQFDRLADQIPPGALVVMPYSLAGIAVAVNYGERRTALLLPLEGDREGAPPSSLATAYLARQLAAGRKVVALLRQPPDPSSLLPSHFDLRPAFSGAISYFHLPQVGALEFPGSTGTALLAYQAFEVHPHGAAPATKSSPDDLRRLLSSGLDFTRPTLPPDVISMKGLSNVEATGRWTDGPVMRLQFAHPLPQRFMLELDISAMYSRDRSVPLKVVVGNEVKDVFLPMGAGTVRIDLASAAPADAIEIRIPNPVSPKSRGESRDPRELGIRLKALRVVASDAPGDKKQSPPMITAPAPEFAGSIDFTNPRLPDFVAGLDGISAHEPRGRWTDAAVARVRLRQPLPRRFTLEIVVADVYEPNRGQPVTVRVGSEAKQFSARNTPQTIRLSFALSQPVDTIEFEIPRPTSPASRGESADPRKLGIRLQALGVLGPGR